MKHAAIVLLCLSVLVAGCQSAKTPEDVAARTFGKQFSDGQGLSRVTFAGNTLVIEVNMKYSKNFKQELGLLLSPRIREIYRSSEADRVKFQVSLPYSDQYGKVEWREKASFVFTRALYSKINWSNFNQFSLLDIAEDVKIN